MPPPPIHVLIRAWKSPLPPPPTIISATAVAVSWFTPRRCPATTVTAFAGIASPPRLRRSLSVSASELSAPQLGSAEERKVSWLTLSVSAPARLRETARATPDSTRLARLQPRSPAVRRIARRSARGERKPRPKGRGFSRSHNRTSEREDELGIAGLRQHAFCLGANPRNLAGLFTSNRAYDCDSILTLRHGSDDPISILDSTFSPRHFDCIFMQREESS